MTVAERIRYHYNGGRDPEGFEVYRADGSYYQHYTLGEVEEAMMLHGRGYIALPARLFPAPISVRSVELAIESAQAKAEGRAAVEP